MLHSMATDVEWLFRWCTFFPQFLNITTYCLAFFERRDMWFWSCRLLWLIYRSSQFYFLNRLKGMSFKVYFGFSIILSEDLCALFRCHFFPRLSEDFDFQCWLLNRWKWIVDSEFSELRNRCFYSSICRRQDIGSRRNIKCFHETRLNRFHFSVINCHALPQ